MPAVGGQVVALEPHPPDSGQIKSRFECDHVVGLERLDALRNQVGRFGMPQAQPMPGVRGEVAVEPVCSEMAANRGTLESIRTAIEDTLYRQGVEPFQHEGEDFDARRQRSVSIVPTDDPERNKTIAGRLRPGFQAGDKLIRPEIVSVHILKK